ncbi:hypothetical protein, partial [Clostridium sardiniense]|uniref:hypothetical protein n=1 Tax=Clostridium sardiniense TaxID=29369 RepID=UPI003D34DAC1
KRKFGSINIGKSNMFSCNDVNGMCPEYEGIGKKLTVDMDRILDKSKYLNEDAILLFRICSWFLALETL